MAFWGTWKKPFALRHLKCQEENFKKPFGLMSRMKAIASCAAISADALPVPEPQREACRGLQIEKGLTCSYGPRVGSDRGLCEMGADQ